VIGLKKKQQVLIEFNMNGKSRRKIAEELGISRNTVRKYIREDQAARAVDVSKLEVTSNYVTPPSYKKRTGTKRVLTNTVMKRIRKMLQENERKRQSNMQKQQLKIIDIHEQLEREGFEISYTTVRNFINSEAKREKEVFVRQKATAGYEAEFDWGEVKLFIGGAKQKSYSLAVFTLPYSNDRYAYLYESETMVCVQDVHMKFIDYLQFVPEVFTYDNMRTVVKSFVGTERQITDGMKHLSMHYNFRIRLCEPRKGNQKGHVWWVGHTAF
jgi:transposase